MMRSVLFRYHTFYFSVGLERTDVFIRASSMASCANVEALRIMTARDTADLAFTARRAQKPFDTTSTIGSFRAHFFDHPCVTASISFLYLCWLSHCSRNTLYLAPSSFFSFSSFVGAITLPALL